MKRLIKIFIALYYKIRFAKKCKINVFSNVLLRGCSFEGENSLGAYTYLSHTTMGLASYIGRWGEFTNSSIGRFCSIGDHVRIVSATHPTEMVSTYPAFYSDAFRLSFVEKSKIIEHLVTKSGKDCEIENDVWIGDNVLIKGGVKIGNGAVIAMGSVVIHDVEPYTINAGVPAKIIRKRFNESTIESLLKIKWWNLPKNWIVSNVDLFDEPQKIIKSLERSGK